MNRRILIVDDNKDIIMMTKLILSNYVIMTALNGREALNVLKDEPHPELILLDHNMPIMDGPEFLTELRRTRPDLIKIPIVMFTAHNIEDVKSSGATEVVTKIGSVDQIRELAEKYLK